MTPFKRSLALLAATLTVTSVMAPVSAQEVTGSHIKRKEAGATGRYSPHGAGSMRAEFNAYGRCFAEAFEVKSRAALQPAYGDEEQAKAVDSLLRLATYNSGECFAADTIRTGGKATSYAGALAEFFIVHRFDGAAVGALADPAWQSVRTPPRNAYERFGACVVHASPPATHALIASVPDSANEKAAIANVVPLLSPCILQGQEVSFDRSSLRSVLSVALYRALVDHQSYMKGSE